MARGLERLLAVRGFTSPSVDGASYGRDLLLVVPVGGWSCLSRPSLFRNRVVD